ncbi:MAG TPA: hypothetical protein VF070_35780 [Streptosporangiaceae bacterium]
MTDLDTLRRALRVEQPSAWSAGQCLDVDQIMTQGRRLRWRRRLAVGGAVVMCAAAAVSGVLAGTSHTGRAAPVPAQRPASVRQTPSYLPPSQAPTLTPSPASSLAPNPAASASSFTSSGGSAPSSSTPGGPSPVSSGLGDPLPTPSR